jgi:hypothetical protein
VARVDHRHRQAGRLQGAQANASNFVAAGGLHHHQRHAQRLQRGDQRRVPLGFVVEPPGVKRGAQHRDIDVCLGYVDAHHH